MWVSFPDCSVKPGIQIPRLEQGPSNTHGTGGLSKNLMRSQGFISTSTISAQNHCYKPVDVTSVLEEINCRLPTLYSQFHCVAQANLSNLHWWSSCISLPMLEVQFSFHYLFTHSFTETRSTPRIPGWPGILSVAHYIHPFASSLAGITGVRHPSSSLKFEYFFWD